jgi:hypothetical protein
LWRWPCIARLEHLGVDCGAVQQKRGLSTSRRHATLGHSGGCESNGGGTASNCLSTRVCFGVTQTLLTVTPVKTLAACTMLHVVAHHLPSHPVRLSKLITRQHRYPNTTVLASPRCRPLRASTNMGYTHLYSMEALLGPGDCIPCLVSRHPSHSQLHTRDALG